MQKPPAPDKINFNLLKQFYQKQFVKYFDERPGNKSLFMDESILKVLSYVIGSNSALSTVKEKRILTSGSISN